MPLSALLLAVISDAASTGDRRARLHELINRLDLRVDPLDLRAAVLAAFGTGLSLGGRRFLLDVLAELEPVYAQLRAPAVRDPSEGSAHLVPPPGLRSSYAPLVGWFADTVREGEDPAYWKAMAEGGTWDASVRPVARGLREVRDWVVGTGRRPPTILEMGWTRAVLSAERWHGEMARRVLESGPAVVIREQAHLLDWDDGWYAVELKTSADLDAEGGAMGHCIGGGAYDNHIGKKYWRYPSLRDPQHKPRLTVELTWIAGMDIPDDDPHRWQVAQAWGPGNRPALGRARLQAVRMLDAVAPDRALWTSEALTLLDDAAIRRIGRTPHPAHTREGLLDMGMWAARWRLDAAAHGMDLWQKMTEEPAGAALTFYARDSDDVDLLTLYLQTVPDGWDGRGAIAVDLELGHSSSASRKVAPWKRIRMPSDVLALRRVFEAGMRALSDVPGVEERDMDDYIAVSWPGRDSAEGMRLLVQALEEAAKRELAAIPG
jgi:hypothetical protein